MSRYRRATAEGSIYFFTLVAYQRQPILCDKAMRDASRAAIAAVRLSRPFTIDAWVLLPDHLHCVWTLPDGDADFSTRWMKIKRAVSLACRESGCKSAWTVHISPLFWSIERLLTCKTGKICPRPAKFCEQPLCGLPS